MQIQDEHQKSCNTLSQPSSSLRAANNASFFKVTYNFFLDTLIQKIDETAEREALTVAWYAGMAQQRNLSAVILSFFAGYIRLEHTHTSD